MRYSELAAKERVVAVHGHVLKGIRTACAFASFLIGFLPSTLYTAAARVPPSPMRQLRDGTIRCEAYGRACARWRSSGWTGRFRAARNVRMAEVIIWTSPDFIRSRIAIWPFSVML